MGAIGSAAQPAAAGNTPVEDALDIVCEWLFTWLLIMTGRSVIFVALLGSCRYEPLLSDNHRIHGAAGALWYSRDGRRIVTSTGQMLAGMAFYVGLVLALVGMFRG